MADSVQCKDVLYILQRALNSIDPFQVSRIHLCGWEKREEDDEKRGNTDKEEEEDAGKEEKEASRGQAVRVIKEQGENATGGEEGDDARDKEGSTAGKLDRRAGGRENEADEEGAGEAP
ncbi:hypothetical protein NDU88_000806 [Pleurodeles waltl]|uniref:Uncharacterized protein n=1 Tax=Pleurodeles waltl TaxID=8319 RepID=A0AAV7WKQ7_PLEWA|nr:hypothetical protein NDU88_000806 [Pleurodeles waltl]